MMVFLVSDSHIYLYYAQLYYFLGMAQKAHKILKALEDNAKCVM